MPRKIILLLRGLLKIPEANVSEPNTYILVVLACLKANLEPFKVH